MLDGVFYCSLRLMEFFLSVPHELSSFYFNGLVKIQKKKKKKKYQSPRPTYSRVWVIFFPSSCTPFNSKAKLFTQLTSDSQNLSNKAPLLLAAKLHYIHKFHCSPTQDLGPPFPSHPASATSLKALRQPKVPILAFIFTVLIKKNQKTPKLLQFCYHSEPEQISANLSQVSAKLTLCNIDSITKELYWFGAFFFLPKGL